MTREQMLQEMAAVQRRAMWVAFAAVVGINALVVLLGVIFL